jgi:hypothetical protein
MPAAWGEDLKKHEAREANKHGSPPKKNPAMLLPEKHRNPTTNWGDCLRGRKKGERDRGNVL